MVEVKGPIVFERAGGTSCLSVAAGKHENDIICSYSNGMIAVYDINTGRCIKSWQLSVSDILTVGATYSEYTKLYSAVRNDKEVIQWSHDCNEPTKFIVTKVQYIVHSLLAPPTPSPIVVYKNGSIELFSSRPRNTRQRNKGELNMNVIQALCCHGNKCHVIVMCSISQYSYCCINYELLNDKFNELNISEINTESVGEFVAMETIRSILLTSWSKGIIVKTNIGQPLLIDDDIVLESDGIIDIAGVNDEYYVTLTKHNELKLYSLVYNTLQSSLTISSSNKVCYCRGYLFALLPVGVHGYSVSCNRSLTLSAAVGKGNITQPLTYQISHHTKLPKNDTITDQDEIIDMCCNDPSQWSTSHVLTKLSLIIESLLNDQDKWNHNKLKSLIEAKVLPINYIASLIQNCFIHSDWALIVSILRNVDTIPEDTLIDLLTAALEYHSEYISLEEKESISKSNLLCLILSFIKNDVMMQQPLTRLSHDHILMLLTFLLDKCDEYVLLAPPTSVLSYENIIDWFGLILDTHFTSLNLIPAVKPLLIDLRQRISNHLTLFSNLAILGQIKTTSNQLIKRQETKKWNYKLDTLKLSI